MLTPPPPPACPWGVGLIGRALLVKTEFNAKAAFMISTRANLINATALSPIAGSVSHGTRRHRQPRLESKHGVNQMDGVALIRAETCDRILPATSSG